MSVAPRLLRTSGTTLRRTSTLLRHHPQPVTTVIRPFSATSHGSQEDSNQGGMPDALSSTGHKGRTGGGKPLDSSAEQAPPKPKISNLSVPGQSTREDLTEEQKKEVDEHNREFEEKHDHGADAPNDKVDKKYWSGRTQGKP